MVPAAERAKLSRLGCGFIPRCELVVAAPSRFCFKDSLAGGSVGESIMSCVFSRGEANEWADVTDFDLSGISAVSDASCASPEGTNSVDCVFLQLVSELSALSSKVNSVGTSGRGGTGGSLLVGGGPGSSRVVELATQRLMHSVTTSAGSLFSHLFSLNSSSMVVMNMCGCRRWTAWKGSVRL